MDVRRTFAAVVALVAIACPLSAAAAGLVAMAGKWDVTLVTNFSSCDTSSVGDINILQLVIHVESGLLKAETVGTSASSDKYTGRLTGDKVVLRAATSGHQATIEATAKDRKLVGRRIVANSGPCVILYDLTAKKQ